MKLCLTFLTFIQGGVSNFRLSTVIFFPWILGLIVHEGAAVYRVFKRWRAVNLHWDVLNYDKATDIEESSRGESSTSRTLWLPLSALRNRNLVHPTQLTSPRFQCGYVLLHLFNRMRAHEDVSEDNGSGEVVMRVTSVWQMYTAAECGTLHISECNCNEWQNHSTSNCTSTNFLKSMLFIWTFELQIHFSEKKKRLLVCFVTCHIFLKLVTEIVMSLLTLLGQRNNERNH